MPIAFEHEVSGSGESASTTERSGAPGKRMLTDRLQRKASGTLPAPSASTTSDVQRVEDNGLSCDQSFVDSIVHGPVQRRGDGDGVSADVHALAAHGTSGSGGALPFLDRIQSSFGAHDVSDVQAHTDGAASDAARGMGAHAFASGNHVAFAGAPDLHTAAHEAAHVVQQRAGVHLKGGVGEEGDAYERHADAVADAVVRGESAEHLLGGMVGAAGSTGVQRKAGLTKDENTNLTDLLLQRAAQSAAAALGQGGGDKLVAANKAISDMWKALGSDYVPQAGADEGTMFKAADAAYIEFVKLAENLGKSTDTKEKALAALVGGGAENLANHMGKSGWKKPADAAELDSRLAAAAAHGDLDVTASERGKLAHLHLRGAAQFIIGDWSGVIGAQPDRVLLPAASFLEQAAETFIDPNFESDLAGAASEIEAVDTLINRIFLYLEQHHPSSVAGITKLAAQQDHLLKLVSKAPHWTERAAGLVPAAAKPKAPAAGGAANSDQPEPDAPRAEPAAHRPVETKEYTRHVHIRDYNYTDEYLGYVELAMKAVKTATGQVYFSHATASPRWESDRARQYLSVSKNIESQVYIQGDKRYCEIYFDVNVLAPGKTETSSVSLEIGNQEEDGALGFKAGIGHSIATTSQGSAATRRVYRIDGVTGIPMTEDFAKRIDFDGFELDDDEVGDDIGSFYANWILESYGA